MKTGNKLWIDVLIVVGMMAVVILLCQPIGRKWNETQKSMYIGEEGEYTVDPDSYFYIRIAKEYTEKGFSSIRLFYHSEEDELKTPLHVGETQKMPVLISAMAAFIWYALSFFGIHVGIYGLCLRLASFILACFVIPLYLFLKKRVSIPATVFGTLFVVLGIPFFRHSAYGFFDTDAFVGLFGIIIVLSFLECVLASDKKKQILYGIISCIATAGLYLSWAIFYIYPLITVGITVFGLLFTWVVIRKKDTLVKSRLLIPGICMLVLILMGLFLGQKDKLSVFLVGLKIKESGGVWPNPSDNISELTRPKLLDASSLWEAFISTKIDYISYLGGFVLSAFLVFAVVICFIRLLQHVRASVNDLSEEVFLFGAVGVWALGALCMTFFGNRYIQFLIIPAGIIAAYGFFYGMDYLAGKLTSVFAKRIWFLIIATIIFLNFVWLYPYLGFALAAVIIVMGFWGGKLSAKWLLQGSTLVALMSALLLSQWFYGCSKYPRINSPYEKAMKWISANTSPDAVVADFWDSGYYLQYYANRRTIADGGTYDGIAFYWLGTMMDTEDERLSAGIMRMLQVDGRSATELATDYCGSKTAAAELLRTILPMNREEARTYLKGCDWSEEKTDRMLALSHPTDCPDIYFVTSADRLKNMIYFQMYDAWDFSGNGQPLVRYYYSTQSQLPLEEDGSITFQLMNEEGTKDYSTTWNVKGEEVTAYVSGTNGDGYECNRVIYEKDGQILYDRQYDSADEGYELATNCTAYFFEEEGRVSVILCQNGNPESTLMNLFLFDGRNQSSFEKVYESGFPESLSIESSDFQKKIDTAAMMKEYPTSRVVVWKVHFDE